MDITIFPNTLCGNLNAIASKSQAHRFLICSAFADGDTELICPQTNEDMEATADCLRALGADIRRTGQGYRVSPAVQVPAEAVLPCRESGSTLRFLLPVAGALGIKATFLMEGRLSRRPLSPLWEEMERMGCQLSRPTADMLLCTGKLHPGAYRIDGSVSSQFISGLLFSFALMDAPSTLKITGKIESRPYIDMTRKALALFPDRHSPGSVQVEGDWSNAAFFLCANALGNSVKVLGLDANSPQGDRMVLSLLEQLRKNTQICAGDIPDLVPILAVVAACREGAVFTDVRRLRLKESDRIASVLAMLRSIGGAADADENALYIQKKHPVGGIVDACGDHRIAMAAAIAATVCSEPVTILGAECVKKSYPGFWEEYRQLGGKYEQYLR